MILEWLGIVLAFLFCLFFILVGISGFIMWKDIEAGPVYKIFMSLLCISVGIFGTLMIPVRGSHFDNLSDISFNFIITPITKNEPVLGLWIGDKETQRLHREYDSRLIQAYINNKLTYTLDKEYNFLGKEIFNSYKLQY